MTSRRNLLKIKVSDVFPRIHSPSYDLWWKGMSEAKVEKIKEASQKILVRPN